MTEIKTEDERVERLLREADDHAEAVVRWRSLACEREAQIDELVEALDNVLASSGARERFHAVGAAEALLTRIRKG